MEQQAQQENALKNLFDREINLRKFGSVSFAKQKTQIVHTGPAATKI